MTRLVFMAGIVRGGPAGCQIRGGRFLNKRSFLEHTPLAENSFAGTALRRLAQRLLPHACLLCGSDAGGERLCAGCRGDLPWHRMPQCPQCAMPTADGQLCGACLKRPPAFVRTRAALTYRFPADQLIQRLKYNGRLAAAPVLGDILAEGVGDVPPPDLLVPMPLHPARIRERGFNHAGEIARRLAHALDLPLATGVCRRVRDTPPQVALAYDARRRNVRGAFACNGDVAGKRVAIVDDVMTTGTSLDELAKTLLKAGAAEVEAWVVARTLPKGEVD
jgi:ComF family protein